MPVDEEGEIDGVHGRIICVTYLEIEYGGDCRDHCSANLTRDDRDRGFNKVRL